MELNNKIDEQNQQKDNRYNNSKIYKIEDVVNGYFYIGSCCTKLSKRFSKHKADAKLQPERKVYKYFNGINWENTKCILLEEHYLDNKEQLLREEDRLIHMYKDDPKCLNSLYAIFDKEKSKEKNKIYRENNKDKRAMYNKTYYQTNKEKLLEHDRIYRENNKEKITLRNKLYNQNNKEERSNYIKKYREEHREKLRVNKRLYFQKNKDIFEIKHNVYYEENKELIRERKKEVYNKNREKILLKLQDKSTCICGAYVLKCNYKKHENTKKHQNFIKDLKEKAQTI